MPSKNVSFQSLIKTHKKIGGVFVSPSDKSITHRAVFFGSLSTRSSVIKDPLLSGDCLSTVRCFKALGVPISVSKNKIKIGAGKKSNFYPLRELKKPSSPLDCGNSGTTMRLISGVLGAQPFKSTLIGDASLSRRPMKRVIEPLSQMGAKIKAREGNFAPLEIEGVLNLRPINWVSKVASAQVKTAVLLAGLFAKGKTTVTEPTISRDHTERMFKGLGLKIGVRLSKKGYEVSVKGFQPLKSLNFKVPGDFSSAAFFIVAALIIPGSKLIVRNVNLNPTRSGLLNVLKRMGGKIKVLKIKEICGEPVGELEVSYSKLKGTSVLPDEIPSMIDEIPVLAVAATQSEGKTVISGAEELRVKESDRLSAMARELSKMGASIKEKKDGLIIEGACQLKGAQVQSYDDHRIAMSLAIASLAAEGQTKIKNFNAVSISYPQFLKDLKRVIRS